ncbi:bifunctional ADP-dependent NAD(P)H-hydrate dehydratase/NAD(P)H-hydrate epimerase, partial [Paracoccus sp. PXZ]
MCDEMAQRPEILTTREMRAVEGAAIGSGSVTGPALMERAGAGVLHEMLALWPEFERPGHAV